jgi:acetylornithine aminotransferase/acetylornithine/N-succinyldiaminopimelate aminotransferase
VQCGIGRTGTFYAFEPAGVRPDAIAMAKGLGGGFPIGAIWVGERSADLFTPGTHGTTFGGTPLACAAALAVLDVIEQERLLENVTRLGAPWLVALKELAADFPAHVRDVRGRGFHIGLEMTGETGPWIEALAEGGLLAAPAGGNVVRLLPPLNVTSADLSKSVEIFRAVLSAKA